MIKRFPTIVSLLVSAAFILPVVAQADEKQKNQWCQISLRKLLLVASVAGAGLGMGGRYYQQYQRQQNVRRLIAEPWLDGFAKAAATPGQTVTLSWDHIAMGRNIAAGIGKIPEDPVLKAHAAHAVRFLADSNPDAFARVLKDHPELYNEESNRHMFFRDAFQAGNLDAAKLMYTPQSNFLEAESELKENLRYDLAKILSSRKVDNPAVLETLRAYEAALSETVTLNAISESDRELNIRLAQTAAKFHLSKLEKKLEGQIEVDPDAFGPVRLLELAVLRGDPAFRHRVNAVVPNASTLALQAAVQVGDTKDIGEELANLEAHPPKSSEGAWQAVAGMIWRHRTFSETDRASRVLFPSTEEKQKQIPSLVFEAARVANWDVVDGFLANGYRANMRHLKGEIAQFKSSGFSSYKTQIENLEKLANMQMAMGPRNQGSNE